MGWGTYAMVLKRYGLNRIFRILLEGKVKGRIRVDGKNGKEETDRYYLKLNEAVTESKTREIFASELCIMNIAVFFFLDETCTTTAPLTLHMKHSNF